jgi:DNA repair protein RecN (Recombination protein N)
MLVHLRLRDFVIVESADIEFDSGFTALTGETGAGKSILLDALGLALGARGEASSVRDGCARADITASFRTRSALDAWLAERELTGDDGIVMLRRVVEADGRSRAFINGHPATVSLLREAGEFLVDIHGQHAAQLLTRAHAQRDMLDAFAGLGDALNEISGLYRSWQACAQALNAAESSGREQALEQERLSWQVNELAALRMTPGEWETLNAEQKRLANAAGLLDGARAAADQLSEGDDALDARLRQLLARLRPLAALDPGLAEAIESLHTASIHLDEAASTLSSYADRVDLDPERLATVEQRISSIFSTARRFRLAPEAIPAELDTLQARLAQLMLAADIEQLRGREEEARAAYNRCAGLIGERRREAAHRFAIGISRHLTDLGMKSTRLEVAIEAATPASHGTDLVEFRIAGAGSASARPLSRIASGGELSRIGLSIAVLAAQNNPVPTLIFDEADAGVGGAVAEIIGALMRRLGDDRQVLCVTHLPQVAAKAHQQLKVSKQDALGPMLSRIEALEGTARIEEIARMLGGVTITATTRKHAREMLANR